MVPADDQAIVLPCASVIVIIVLLNEAATCATPDAIFLRSRRRTRVASLPILYPFAPVRRDRRRAYPVIKSVPEFSSCRQWSSPAPCGSVHWCECAARERGVLYGGAGRGSSRGPSDA